MGCLISISKLISFRILHASLVIFKHLTNVFSQHQFSYFFYQCIIIKFTKKKQMQNFNFLLSSPINQNFNYNPYSYVKPMMNYGSNPISKNSTIFYAVVTKAISTSFKIYETQFLMQRSQQQIKKKQLQEIAIQNQIKQKTQPKNKSQVQKNSKSKSESNKPVETPLKLNIPEKTQKVNEKSKVQTSDEACDKNIVQYDYSDSNAIINKNVEFKKQKNIQFQKINKYIHQTINKVNPLLQADINFNKLESKQLKKKRDGLMMRMVQNWSETANTRRKQKLQLRRIKY